MANWFIRSSSPYGGYLLNDGEAVEVDEAARVAEVKLNGVFADVAVAAEYLNGVVASFEYHFVDV